MNMKKLIIVAFLITLVSASYGQDIEATKRLSNQSYFGITPDEKYGLPNNIGISLAIQEKYLHVLRFMRQMNQHRLVVRIILEYLSNWNQQIL